MNWEKFSIVTIQWTTILLITIMTAIATTDLFVSGYYLISLVALVTGTLMSVVVCDIY